MTQAAIDHDLLFKELLTTFFWDFLELFAPEVAQTAEQDTLEFLTQEVFSDLLGQKRRNVDLVVKLRFRGQDTCFLIHVENQSSAQKDFAERMFLYFARLYEKYRLPIYPVALFSFDRPRRPEPTQFTMGFDFKEILRFSFQVIQLNRLNWRDFIRQENPAAAALMAKMNFTPEERPRVKLECLRMITTLNLDPAKTHLLSSFVDTYLRLDMAEQQIFEQELQKIKPQEAERVLRLTTSWLEEGLAKGLAQGLQEGLQEGRQKEASKFILRFLEHRFPDDAAIFTDQIQALTLEQLEGLSDCLFDFESITELEAWFKEFAPDAPEEVQGDLEEI